MVLGLRGFPGVQGGVEKHAEQLYPLLVERGCQIDVIVRSSYMPRNIKSWKGIGFHRLWAPRLAAAEALLHSIFGVIYAAIKRPDVLHIHAIGPAIVTPLAKLFKLRVVVTHHGPDYDREKWGRLARWLLRLGEKWGMEYSDQRIAVSNYICKLIRGKYNIDSVVIPNGVNIPEIPITTHTLEKYALDKKRYIILVSRFVQEKRHLDLINAFDRAHLPGWKLVLVGDADHPSDYSREIKAKSKAIPNVVLTGFQSGHELAELYANAGIFVLPSSHEGLPIVMLEALSYGLSVYASDIPANMEVGLPNHHYFSLGNVEQLSRMLKEYSTNNYGNEGIRRINTLISEKYNWSTIAQKTLHVYQTLRTG
jgi:glycosyltransferase involved in cell wall biosynthesis